jgi:hypothetical protein
MIIFLNEDRAYLYWITHHHQGFVLDGRWKPKLGHLKIHRSTCQEIKSSVSRRTHWTTGSKLKACCLDRGELDAWALEESGGLPGYCSICQPQNDALPNDGHVHLSKLASDLLDHILEVALIHLDVEQPPYRLTVADIAACFGKTPGQISSVLHHLRDGGFVTVPGHKSTTAVVAPKQIVLPTVIAMRTLEAFRNESDSTIQNELAKLEAD